MKNYQRVKRILKHQNGDEAQRQEWTSEILDSDRAPEREREPRERIKGVTRGEMLKAIDEGRSNFVKGAFDATMQYLDAPG